MDSSEDLNNKDNLIIKYSDTFLQAHYLEQYMKLVYNQSAFGGVEQKL